MSERHVERTVRNGGIVKVNGHWYECPKDAVTRPAVGERLWFYDYMSTAAERGLFIGESSSPPDPDGYLRRMFWDELTPPDSGTEEA